MPIRSAPRSSSATGTPALLTAIAIVGGSLERFATEVRNLQHTEIGEVQEPFRAGQKGSSAMPHKRNPILSERIAGLARLLRGYAHTALEDQPLWHERDISHSSAERVILPDATIVLDYMLVRMTALVDGLIVRSERMRENIARGLGLHASSRVLVALVDEGGLSREDAYADRPAGVAAGRRRARRRCATCSPSTRRSPSGCRSRSSTRASTTRRSCATSRRSSPGSTGWRTAWRPAPRHHGRRPMLAESFLRSGKVRDLYMLDDGRLLLVASDRISAFDVVLPTTIPDKGRVLTGLSRFWFAETAGIVPNHLLATDPAASARRSPPMSRRRATTSRPGLDELRGRMMICRPATVVPIEAVVRGYLAGSGWKEYREHGTVCGIALPAGLRESDRLPEPIFTPATKAELGDHDENIDFDRMIEHIAGWLLGGDVDVAGALAEAIRDRALRLYGFGAAVAARRGILLADTKFEFGLAERRPPRARSTHFRRRTDGPARPADPHRRGADARFVALLGCCDLRSPDARRRASTSSSSATGSRPSRGTRRPRARPCPTTSSPAPVPATSRPTSGSPAPASSAICRRT